MNKKKILYILKHNPWGVGGGCYACRNYMDAFMDVFHDADFDFCICEEYLKDRDIDYPKNVRFIGVRPRGKLNKLLSPITGLLHRHQKMAMQMLKDGGYDYCIFDESGIAGSLVDTAMRCGVKTIVINHNYQVEYSRDNITSRVKRLLILPVVEKCERHSFLYCDYNIFLTEEDRCTFGKVYGNSNTKSIVGGCFLKKGETIDIDAIKPINNGRLRIVISGTIGNVQNLDGINYFLDELYYALPDDIDVIITGKNPTAKLMEKIKSFPNVSIIANPKDIMAVVRECDIFLCPTRLGGGMKLRLMDGLRNGLPVLTHRTSARGYGEFKDNGILWEYDDVDSFREGFSSIVDAIRVNSLDKLKIVNYANEVFVFETVVKRLKKTIIGFDNN